MKGATSRKRLRLTENTEFSVLEHILHSTPINEDDENGSTRATFHPNPRDVMSPIVINAPSGFPHFTAVLQQHGFVVTKPRNRIQVDQLIFRKNLSDWMETKRKDASNGNNEATKFITGMEGYLRTTENFDHSMTPTLHPDEVFQDSLLHNLLSIPVLQPNVIKIILPAISDIACTASSQEAIDRFGTMLGQLKWLPSLAGLKSYTSFLLGTVENATNGGKLTLIKFLPDIIPETQHAAVVTTLKEMLDAADSPIVSAIMECFSSLDISPKEWEEVRTAAITQMFTAPLQDFPAYFAFLFRTEDVMILSQIISELREKLELTSFGDSGKDAVHMVEIVEKVRFCASINSHLVPTWVKQVKDDLGTGDMESIKPLDLMMLLIFGETFKSALLPLRLICLEGKLAVKLLDHLLKHNMPIVNQVYQTLTKLCDSFLRNPKDVKAHPTIQRILVKLFIALSPLETQEITANLICILMNGDPNCRDVIFQIFTKITEKAPKKLLFFAPHLMVVLEGALRFPANQIRQLMNILASLAHIKDSTDSERFGSEFTILLRKYLTHSNTQNRCFGVLGTLATVHQLSTTKEVINEARIQELLRLAWSFMKREEEPCCIFFDEFSSIVETLPLSVCHDFYSLISESFIGSWTNMESTRIPLQKLQNKQSTLKLMAQLGVDQEAETDDPPTVLIFEEKPLGMNPRVIPAHARLFFQLTAKVKEDTDLILAAPLLFPDIELYYKRRENIEACTFSQRFSLGNYLLLGINYFRESISAFVGKEEDESLQIQVWYRLSNVIFLQQVLVQNLHQFPSLPTAYITGGKTMGLGGGDGAGPSTSTDFKKPKPKGKGGKGKKSKNKKDDEGTKSEGGKNVEVSVQPPQLVPYLRRFDSVVFKLLEAPLSFKENPHFDTLWEEIREGGTSVKAVLEKVAQLQPEALSLLLLELNQQTRDTENGFNLLDLEDLIKWITNHLERISDAFNNSSLVLGSRKLEECFQLILTTLSCYFEKVGKLDESVERERFYEGILDGLTATQGLGSMTTEEEKIEGAVNFLKKVSGSVRKPVNAVEHLKVLSNFHSLFPNNETISEAVVEVAESYLRSNWKLSPTHVDLILRTWVLKSSAPLTVMRTITTSLIEPNHGDLEACNATNFHTWYSVILALLAQHVAKNGKRATASPENGISFWKESVLIFKDLVFLTETYREPPIFTALLKHSRVFIDSYTNLGTRLLPSFYDEDVPAFKSFVRTLQMSTRKLQIICEHSKIQKDTKLMRNVPQMKRSLESLVFRVRELCTVTGIAEAFSMGSLRHKDLDGEEFSSQPFNQPSRRRDDEEEDEDPMMVDEEEKEDESESEEDEYSFDH